MHSISTRAPEQGRSGERQDDVRSPYATAPSHPAGNQVNLIQLNLPDWPYASTGFYYLWDATAW